MKYLKTKHIFLGLFSALLIISEHSHAGQFFDALYDVPIMQGMAEVREHSLVFDTPAGRIAETAAYVDKSISQADVLRFYTQTLPQMGWNNTGVGIFKRETEVLRLSFDSDGQSVKTAGFYTFFRLSPQE